MKRPGKDVIIVGGGLAGLSCAYTLGGAELSVLVLERGDQPGAKNMSGGRLYLGPVRALAGELLDGAPFERRVVKESLTLMALLLCALLTLSPTDYRLAVLTFAAGSGLGYFLELWGTTRLCWTYYTRETPPLFAVLAHGMAAVAFWRAGLLLQELWGRLTEAVGRRGSGDGASNRRDKRRPETGTADGR